MRSRVPRKSVDFESIDLGDSLHSYPPGTNPNNLVPYKVRLFSNIDNHVDVKLLQRIAWSCKKLSPNKIIYSMNWIAYLHPNP